MGLRLRCGAKLLVRLRDRARGITDRHCTFKDRSVFSTQQDIVGAMVATTSPQNSVRLMCGNFFPLRLEPSYQFWVEQLRPCRRASLATELCQIRDNILCLRLQLATQSLVQTSRAPGRVVY